MRNSNQLAECFQNAMEIVASDMLERQRRQTKRSSKVYPEKLKSEKRQKEIPSQIIVEEHTLCKAEIIVGRDMGNDLKLDSSAVSGSHAVIIFDVDRWMIRDNISSCL